jgi:hypothetical protein
MPESQTYPMLFWKLNGRDEGKTVKGIAEGKLMHTKTPYALI